MRPAVEAAEEVGRRSLFLVETRQVLLDLLGRPAVLVVLAPKDFERIGVCLDLIAPRAAEELCSVTAVIEPVLLLSAGEAGRALRDILRDRAGHVIRHTEPDIRELSVELLCGGSVCNAPGAKSVNHVLLGVDRAGVDEPTLVATSDAVCLRGDDHTSRARVRVIAELWERQVGRRLTRRLRLARFASSPSPHPAKPHRASLAAFGDCGSRTVECSVPLGVTVGRRDHAAQAARRRQSKASIGRAARRPKAEFGCYAEAP
jgi:hypothetical protein